MKRSRFTESRIVSILKEADAGVIQCHAPGFVGVSNFTDEVLQSPHQD